VLLTASVTLTAVVVELDPDVVELAQATVTT
jgi:hypothetical protein